MNRKLFFRAYLMIMILTAGSCSPKPDPKTPANLAMAASPAENIPTPTTEILTTPLPDKYRQAEFREQFRDGLIKGEQSVLEALPGASQYILEIWLADDLTSLKGHQLVRYTNREDAALGEVYFRLFANTAGGSSQLSSVIVGGRTLQPVYEYNKSAARLTIDPPLPVGETVEIGLDFVVSIPDEMGGNYGLFGFFDGALVLDEFYPVIPVYDEQGWNVEMPPPNSDMPFYDASFYEVIVSAPPDLFLAASGVEVNRQEFGDRQVVTFAAGPARGFYIAASQQFTVTSLQAGETMINVYAAPGQVQAAARALETARGALASFGEYLAPYPYSELDIVSTPMQALGMEYPGIVAISSRLFSDPQRIHSLESTIAHEIGHQWFFNLVGNDQVDHPWLDEALVQYLTYRYYLDFRGPEAAEAFMETWQTRWERVEKKNIPIGLPSGKYSDVEYAAIVYGRGPIFIKTLAERMGVDTFDVFLRDYVGQNRWEIGTPEGFKQLAEIHCRCDLTSMFEEWVTP